MDVNTFFTNNVEICDMVTFYTCSCEIHNSPCENCPSTLEEALNLFEISDSDGNCFLSPEEIQALSVYFAEQVPYSGEYIIQDRYNFMDPSPNYILVDLTDPCNPQGGMCDMNPVYGGTNDFDRAI